jgi:hypothetical protein
LNFSAALPFGVSGATTWLNLMTIGPPDGASPGTLTATAAAAAKPSPARQPTRYRTFKAHSSGRLLFFCSCTQTVTPASAERYCGNPQCPAGFQGAQTQSMALLAGHPERDFPKPRVLQLLPAIAVGVLLLAVVGLLWLVDHNARQAARNDLIQDALWVEQSLRFQLRSAEERVRESAESAGDQKQWLARARSLLSVHPEILRLTLMKTDGTVVTSEPPVSNADMAMAKWLPQRLAAFEAAEQGGTTYSAPFTQPSGQSAFDLFVPIGAEAPERGVIMATFSMNAMIAHNVPWWFSQKYELRVVDAEGIVLAASSRLGERNDGAKQIIPFNPPAGNLSMIVVQRAAVSPLGSYIVMSSIVALALVSAVGVYFARHQAGPAPGCGAQVAGRARPAPRDGGIADGRPARPRPQGARSLRQLGVLPDDGIPAGGADRARTADALLAARGAGPDADRALRRPRRDRAARWLRAAVPAQGRHAVRCADLRGAADRRRRQAARLDGSQSSTSPSASARRRSTASTRRSCSRPRAW